MSLKIGARTKLGLFFPVVCFIHVFDQTLTEQLYRDRGLLRTYFHFNGGSGEGGRGTGRGLCAVVSLGARLRSSAL